MSFEEFPVMEFALSFPVNVRSLPPKGLDITLKTDEKERDKLAKNHNLVAVKAFEADLHVGPWKKQGVRIIGRVCAQIVQECVVTSELLENRIDEEVDVIYVPDGSRLAEAVTHENEAELFLDAEGPDAPEVFSGSEIDVGAVAEEFFELAIDAYPRKADAEFDEVIIGDADDDKSDEKVSPFAVLERLKRS